MNRLILAAIMAVGVTGLAATPASARNYDCTKAGNANKAECKSGAKPTPKAVAAKPAAKAAAKAAAKPATKPTVAAKTVTKVETKTVVKSERSYDCTKAGNANKTVCKAAAAAKPKAPSVASADDKNPVGAIGRCRDGMYSHSKQRVGACSRHGGVAKWS